MAKAKAMLGALAIMMAAGMIVDFELAASDDDIVVRVWSTEDSDDQDASLRRHVEALLSPHIGDGSVVVVRPTA